MRKRNRDRKTDAKSKEKAVKEGSNIYSTLFGSGAGFGLRADATCLQAKLSTAGEGIIMVNESAATEGIRLLSVSLLYSSVAD